MSRMAELYAEHQQEMQEQQEAEFEIYSRTLNILWYLKDILSPEDFSLMCYHSGFSIHDFEREQV